MEAPEDIILEWEQRKKSRAGGGAPCESRKTVFCVPLLWQAIPVMIRLERLAGDINFGEGDPGHPCGSEQCCAEHRMEAVFPGRVGLQGHA